MLGLTLGPRALTGQTLVQPALGIAAQYVRLRAELPGETDLSSGAAAGVEGALTIGGLVQVDVTYLQGTLHAPSGGAGSRDLIEGRAGLGLAPLRWLAVSLGPHVRSYVTPAGTERWVRWEARARAQGPIALPGVTGYVEAWRVLSATIDLPGAFDRGQGGAAGITARLPHSPGWWARLAYGVDRVALTGRQETVETVLLVVGIGQP
jgi:hypothetical protein